MNLESTKLPIQREPGVIYPGIKRPGHEADYLLPYSAKVENIGVTLSVDLTSS
jgi:hypothetical protein